MDLGKDTGHPTVESKQWSYELHSRIDDLVRLSKAAGKRSDLERLFGPADLKGSLGSELEKSEFIRKTVEGEFARDVVRLPCRFFEWFFEYDCVLKQSDTDKFISIPESSTSEYLLRWSSKENIPGLLKVSSFRIYEEELNRDESCYYLLDPRNLTSKIKAHYSELIEGTWETARDDGEYVKRELEICLNIFGRKFMRSAKGEQSKVVRGEPNLRIFFDLERDALFIVRTGCHGDLPIPIEDVYGGVGRGIDKRKPSVPEPPRGDELWFRVHELACRCASYVGRTDLGKLFDEGDGKGEQDDVCFRTYFIQNALHFGFEKRVSALPAWLFEWFFAYDCLLIESSWSSYMLSGDSSSERRSIRWNSSENVPALIEVSRSRASEFSSSSEIEYYLADPRGLTGEIKECYSGLVAGKWVGEDGPGCDITGGDDVYLSLLNRWYASSASGAHRSRKGDPKWPVWSGLLEGALLVDHCVTEGPAT